MPATPPRPLHVGHVLSALACGAVSGLASPLVAEWMVDTGLFPRGGEALGLSSEVVATLMAAAVFSALCIVCLRRTLHLCLLAFVATTPVGVYVAVEYRFAESGIESNLFPLEILFWWCVVALVFGLEYLLFASIRSISHRTRP